MAAAGVPTAVARLCRRPTRSPPRSTRSDRRTSSRTTASRPARASSSPTTVTRPSSTRPRAGDVVVEEYLDGPEVSLFAISDGTTVVPMLPAQDFKRILDGDEGPNTGGMGAYTPLPWAPADLVAEIERDVIQPTIDEMARRGTPFRGLLYAGLALTVARPAGRRVQRPLRRPRDPAAAGPARLAALAAARGRRDRHAGRRAAARVEARRRGGGRDGLGRATPSRPSKGDVIVGTDDARQGVGRARPPRRHRPRRRTGGSSPRAAGSWR